MTLQEYRDKVADIEVNYDYDKTYSDLYNVAYEYMEEYNDYDLEYLFEEYIDYDLAEEMAKHELEEGGLARLYYFLGDANCNNDLFRVDGYGNLSDIGKDDLDYLKEEILSNIEDKLNTEGGEPDETDDNNE